MAKNGQVVVNELNKQTIEFVTTASDSHGVILEMIACWLPCSPKPPAHYHPLQTEYFKVIEGELTVQLDRKEVVYKKDASFIIQKNSVHAMWNNSNAITRVKWQVKPAMKTEYLLEHAARLGKYKNKFTRIVKTVVLLVTFRKEFRIGRMR